MAAAQVVVGEGCARAAEGELEEALRVWDEAFEAAEAKLDELDCAVASLETRGGSLGCESAGVVDKLRRDAEALVDALRSEGREGDAKRARRERVRIMYLDGRLLRGNDPKRAEELLCRAVKLDPLNSTAWNKLAELLWQRGDLEAARNCLATCVEQRENKEALRLMSMLLRKMGTTPKEKVGLMRESLALAKRAVAIDYSDAESWYVMGNTYLSLFFAMSHKRKDLESALKAYGRSEGIQQGAPGRAPNADLYFNRAQVRGFLEDYELAISDYERAKALDAGLPCDERIDAIRRKVKGCADLIARKGHAKPKRLAGLAAGLGADTGSDVATEAAPASVVRARSLGDLVEGENKGARLDLRVVMPLVRTSDPPVSFLVVDRDETLFGLSVYHLDSSVLAKVRSDRDRITVVDPVLRQVCLDEVTFPLVQLNFPTQFLVNGEPLKSSFAHAAIDSNNLT